MLKNISKILEGREFVSVATCDFKGRPNAAPKFLLKIENSFLYLIDYSFGHTWENLKINPRVSVSFVDTETLMGYQLNGAVDIIKNGPVYQAICEDVIAKEIDLSAKRIIEGVSTERSHKNFEISMSEKFLVYKINIEEVVQIGTSGELKREKIEK
ncbi:MAG: pyridoxamine 5'-phosphate oxidase family protein [Candidatus Omnitrophica bacterium]|nr:pyridoxamine 5'-phosphate oxidase family protein [Candidatus Omnitrophota bacterium]